MSYTKKNWQDLPNTTTPITATELNRMENGIADANGAIGADAYDSTATYDVNDLCIYNNTLYICTTAISTAEAWNSNHWKAISLDDMLISKTESNNVTTGLNKLIDFNCLHGVVESGSNANGNYIKFGDGTLIQSGIGTCPARVGYAEITFPVDFFDTGYVMNANHKYNSSNNYGGSAQLRNITNPQPVNKTTAYIYSYMYDATIANYPRNVQYIAVGRWK